MSPEAKNIDKFDHIKFKTCIAEGKKIYRVKWQMTIRGKTLQHMTACKYF